MDHIQEEDCIPVGSTGTLLALMGKEMEILQARRSCSASPYNHLHYCKKSPPNSAHYASYYSAYHGSPATPSMSPSSSSSPSSFVASLWSDLKSLLRSPSSMHHHNFAAHTPLIYHSNGLFCKGQQHINEDYDSLYSRSPPLRPYSHPLSYPSPKRTYPNQAMPHPQAPPHLTSPSSKGAYPKQKVATEASFHINQKPSMDEGCFQKKADYPNGKSPLHNCAHKRSDLVYLNRSDANTGVYQANPSAEIDQDSRKDDCLAQERSSHAGTAVVKSSPKGKAMDAVSSNRQYAAYPKAKAMDAVYAMRRRSTASDVHSQNGKVLQDKEAREGARTSRPSGKKCSRRRVGEREITCCSNAQEQAAYCMQKREERSGNLQSDQYPCVRKREERVCLQGEMEKREERVCCMQESYEGGMQKPMLGDRWQQDSCTRGSRGSSPYCKPSRSFGGRSLPLVSVVDLQCCLTAERCSSRRLSFTRLASF